MGTRQAAGMTFRNGISQKHLGRQDRPGAPSVGLKAPLPLLQGPCPPWPHVVGVRGLLAGQGRRRCRMASSASHGG